MKYVNSKRNRPAFLVPATRVATFNRLAGWSGCSVAGSSLSLHRFVLNDLYADGQFDSLSLSLSVSVSLPLSIVSH